MDFNCQPHRNARTCKNHPELTVLVKETAMSGDHYISASLSTITEAQMKWESRKKKGMIVSVCEGRKYLQK